MYRGAMGEGELWLVRHLQGSPRTFGWKMVGPGVSSARICVLCFQIGPGGVGCEHTKKVKAWLPPAMAMSVP